MILEKVIVGPMQVNCYILGCPTTHQAIVIDPGAEAEKIKSRLRISGLKLNSIVNTHGHADHIGANAQLGAPVSIHRLDAGFLTDPKLNLSATFGLPITSPKADLLLDGGESLKVGQLCLEVIHTPGHSPGGICLKTDKLCFTGDTLFAQGVGRTDIPWGSEQDLHNSIRTKLFNLEDEVLIYPGHGPSSTIGREKNNNRFI